MEQLKKELYAFEGFDTLTKEQKKQSLITLNHLIKNYYKLIDFNIEKLYVNILSFKCLLGFNANKKASEATIDKYANNVLNYKKLYKNDDILLHHSNIKKEHIMRYFEIIGSLANCLLDYNKFLYDEREKFDVNLHNKKVFFIDYFMEQLHVLYYDIIKTHKEKEQETSDAVKAN